MKDTETAANAQYQKRWTKRNWKETDASAVLILERRREIYRSGRAKELKQELKILNAGLKGIRKNLIGMSILDMSPIVRQWLKL